MRVYAIIAPGPNRALADAVARNFPGQNFDVYPGQHLVATTGLSLREVASLVGDEGQVGNYFILPFDHSWGWHRKDMWDWIKSRVEA